MPVTVVPTSYPSDLYPNFGPERAGQLLRPYDWRRAAGLSGADDASGGKALGPVATVALGAAAVIGAGVLTWLANRDYAPGRKRRR